MKNTQRTLEQIDQEITKKSKQLEAIRYAKHLTEKQHKNALDMVEHVPNNIYIEDWKAEEKYLAKMLEQLQSIYDELAEQQSELCREFENVEQRQRTLEQLMKERDEQKQATQSQKTTKKGYIFKDTITNLENNTKQVYFIGVDGYVQYEPKYCTPYKLRKAVENRIKKDINFWGNSSYSEKLDEMSYIEGGKYLHICEIIEIEY